MIELPPLPRNQRSVDANHLKLLSIFHFVAAGLALMGILFLLAHYTFMHAIMDNSRLWQRSKQGPPPVEIFMILKWFYAVFALWFVGSGILNLISGLCIRARKYRTFSLVVAGLDCVHIPFGTVLGVFTIIVLLRDSVREAYGEA